MFPSGAGPERDSAAIRRKEWPVGGSGRPQPALEPHSPQGTSKLTSELVERITALDAAGATLRQIAGRRCAGRGGRPAPGRGAVADRDHAFCYCYLPEGQLFWLAVTAGPANSRTAAMDGASRIAP